MPEKIGRIGVCAMEHKARSKPCRAILNNLMQTGEFDLVLFNDKVILDEPIESWPNCDFLISFFSSGFPLQKAIDYVNLRKPFLVNDLELQKVLWDRRLVLRLLEAAHVPTPERLVISRDGGPRVDPEVKAKLEKHGVACPDFEPEVKFRMVDYDTLELEDGRRLVKPFVEKPVDGEDHNVFVYYPKASGGGGRRLFRKVGNKSSEFDPELSEPRTEGSYIYEKFMDTDNFEDVKAYTVGPHFCHAETRKSPVVDGIVRRNTYGKELRFVTKLSEEERTMAANVCTAFEQTICGFDLLRVGDRSFVIDVNGFSFVKDNAEYYIKCAQILRDLFLSVKQRLPAAAPDAPAATALKEEEWRLKSQIMVIRHADRTPKQKFKFTFKSKQFLDLLQGHRCEVIIREKEHLNKVLGVVDEAIKHEAEDPQKLAQLRNALAKKIGLPGTKVQLKPGFVNKDPREAIEKVQVIIKWGGEPTHSSLYQSEDLGEQTRKDSLLLNSDALNDCRFYSSSERRVTATARTFADTLLHGSDYELHIEERILDDSNAAKTLMDEVKKRLKLMLRKGRSPPPQFAWPSNVPQPFVVLSRVVDLMQYHRRIMGWHFENDNVETFQERWCCSEDPALFRERWEKLYKEFESVEKVDPAKISELYDTIKFDALHNRAFLERVFELPEDGVEILPADPAMPLVIPHEAEYSGKFKFAKAPMTLFDRPEYARLRELYLLAKVLFDYVCPQEYGITNDQKLDIGLLTSMPLVQKIIEDLEYNRHSEQGRSVFYFTKESHMYTVLGIIFGSHFPVKLKRNQLPELDYLAQVAFEMYECQSWDEETGEPKLKHQVRITISPGCNSLSPLDVQLDSKHCISCVPRRSLTHYLDYDDMIEHLRSQFSRVTVPNDGVLPVKIRLNEQATSSQAKQEQSEQVQIECEQSIGG